MNIRSTNLTVIFSLHIISDDSNLYSSGLTRCVQVFTLPSRCASKKPGWTCFGLISSTVNILLPNILTEVTSLFSSCAHCLIIYTLLFKGYYSSSLHILASWTKIGLHKRNVCSVKCHVFNLNFHIST